MLAENYFNTANQLKDSGQLYTAMVAYQKVLTIKPDYVEAYKKLAEVYLLQGNFDAAISTCKEAVKIQPDFASAYLTLGNIFQSQNLFEQAINTYERALNIQPDFAQVYANLGSVYYKQRQFNLAIFNYQKALEINPKLASVQLMLGNVFAHIGEFDRAVYCYQKLQQLKPEEPKAYFKLAEVFALYTNLEPAFDYYQKSLSIKPNYREAFSDLYKLLKPETTEQELDILFADWQDFALVNNHNIERYLDSVIQVEEGRRKKEEGRRKREEGRGKKEEGRRKKWMWNQTPNNYKYSVEDGGLNSKEKDKSSQYLEQEKFTAEQNREIIESDEDYEIQATTFNLIPEQTFEALEKNTDNLYSLNQGEKNQEHLSQGKTFENQELETETYLDSVIQHQSSQYLEQEKFTAEQNREIIESDEDHEIKTANLNLIPEQTFEALEKNTDNLSSLNQGEKHQENLSQGKTFENQELETEKYLDSVIQHQSSQYLEQEKFTVEQNREIIESDEGHEIQATTFNLIPEQKFERSENNTENLHGLNQVKKNQENLSQGETFENQELETETYLDSVIQHQSSQYLEQEKFTAEQNREIIESDEGHEIQATTFNLIPEQKFERSENNTENLHGLNQVKKNQENLSQGKTFENQELETEKYLYSVIQHQSSQYLEQEKFTVEQNREIIESDEDYEIQATTFNLIPEQTFEALEKNTDNLSSLNQGEKNQEHLSQGKTFENQELETETYLDSVIQHQSSQYLEQEKFTAEQNREIIESDEDHEIKTANLNLIPEQTFEALEKNTDNLSSLNQGEKNQENLSQGKTFENQELETEKYLYSVIQHQSSQYLEQEKFTVGQNREIIESDEENGIKTANLNLIPEQKFERSENNTENLPGLSQVNKNQDKFIQGKTFENQELETEKYLDSVIQHQSSQYLEQEKFTAEQNREIIESDEENGIKTANLNLIPEQKFERSENNTENLPGLSQVNKNQDKFIQGKTFENQELETEKYLDSVIQHQSSQYLEQEKFTVEQNREIIESDEGHEIQATTFNLIPEQKFERSENNTENLPGLNQVKKNQENLSKGKTFENQELETEKYLDSVIQYQSSQYLEQEKFTAEQNREIIESDEDYEIQATTFNLIPEQTFEALEKNTDNLSSLNQGEKNQENLSKGKTFENQELETEFPKKLLKYPAAETYRNQADIALGQGNLAVAIARCKEALKIQPDYAPCYVTLGNAFYRQNNLAAALSAYNRALEIEPEVAEVYGNVGSVYLQLGQYKQALFYYQKAVYLKPGLAGVYWNIGKLFQYLGKVDEALEYWEKALEIQPDIVEADFHFKLGNTLVKMSRINDAVRSYQRAINLKPDYTEAYSNLANILGKQGDREAVIKYYQKALSINPELKHLHEKIANNLLLKGDYDQAIFHYQEAIKYNSNSYDAYANLGTALSNKGLLESALEKYHKALELKPNWAEVYSRIGHIIKQEKMEEAIALFEKAIEVKPQFVEAHQQLCDLLSHTTKLAHARKAADNFCNSCGEIAPILSGTAFLFAYFQSGVSGMANSKLSEVEKNCYQSCETFSELEIKLLYEIFLFAVPHLRDNLEGNSKFYKLIAKQYYQNRVKNYQTPKTHISTSQPLKIGFLSKHFRRHSVGWCSEALIRELSQITPYIHLYITGPLKRDDITQKFEQMSVKTYWPKKYPNGFPSYEEIVEQILEDKLDVVVDLDSMTLPVNVHIIHEKPAPVCVSWLGFDAPYISENNYFLCDWYTHPEGREKYYLEKLVRLPETSVAVGGFDSHLVDRNTARNSIGIDSDKMVYLCIAPGRKTNPEMVRAQLKILQHTPESILIRKGQGDVDVIYQTYRQESENLGVDFNRIIFLGQTQTEEEHRAIYQIADVLLDSYPYNGGTHNLEALWANLPIITRAGEQYLSRMGYSFLQNVNLDIGVAWSWEEYTEWGIKLGKDLGLRNSVREHLQNSKNPDNLAPLWNPKKLAKQMYQIFVELLV
ncbi:tetratricopeptide repeat protein [Okeania sp. KiyG1]|uniref:tetratricopeptide repeat protein n=1 Tax=Okeania sp. KiyG1 TaxID=2720165 RepID=UPI001F41F21A|nr:tetratricopeptide repeat protein [Okeania sp. KiyG1]